MPAIRDAELLHGPVQVRFDGPHREDEAVRDLAFVRPPREVDELLLAPGQHDVAAAQALDGGRRRTLAQAVELGAARGGAAGGVLASLAGEERRGVRGRLARVPQGADPGVTCRQTRARPSVAAGERRRVAA